MALSAVVHTFSYSYLLAVDRRSSLSPLAILNMMAARRRDTNYTFLVGVLAYLAYIDFLHWRGKALVLLLAWLLAGGHHTLYLAYHTLGLILTIGQFPAKSDLIGSVSRKLRPRLLYIVGKISL